MAEDEPTTPAAEPSLTELAADVEALKEANESTVEAVQELIDGNVDAAEDDLLDALADLGEVSE